MAVAIVSYLLTAPTHEGMARLSWPGWLIKYQDGENATRTREESPNPVLTWPDVVRDAITRPVWYGDYGELAVDVEHLGLQPKTNYHHH